MTRRISNKTKNLNYYIPTIYHYKFKNRKEEEKECFQLKVGGYKGK